MFILIIEQSVEYKCLEQMLPDCIRWILLYFQLGGNSIFQYLFDGVVFGLFSFKLDEPNMQVRIFINHQRTRTVNILAYAYLRKTFFKEKIHIRATHSGDFAYSPDHTHYYSCTTIVQYVRVQKKMQRKYNEILVELYPEYNPSLCFLNTIFPGQHCASTVSLCASTWVGIRDSFNHTACSHMGVHYIVFCLCANIFMNNSRKKHFSDILDSCTNPKQRVKITNL